MLVGKHFDAPRASVLAGKYICAPRAPKLPFSSRIRMLFGSFCPPPMNRDPRTGNSVPAHFCDINGLFSALKFKKKHFCDKKPSKKNTAILEVFGLDRIGVGPTPFSAISLLQAQLTQETLPPLVALGGGGRGGRGVRAAGRLGLAGGSGGWLVAGRLGAGAGWWVWRHGGMVAWVHGRE